MENKSERYKSMLDTVLRIVSIVVSIIGTVVRIIEVLDRNKDKIEQKKSNRTRQS